MELFGAAVVLIAIMSLDRTIRRLERRVQRSETLLMRLAEQAGIPDGGHDLSSVREILARQEGDKTRVAAVREYRKVTGAGLREAIAAVDRMSSRTSPL